MVTYVPISVCNKDNTFKIEDNLFLGDSSSSNAYDIDLVINCTSDLPFNTSNVNAKKIRIPIEDNGMYIDIIYEYWRDENLYLFSVIDKYLTNKKKVLIHCLAGRQRSAATVAAFLMWKYGINHIDAISYIKMYKRDAFFPNINFLLSLKNYELYNKKDK